MALYPAAAPLERPNQLNGTGDTNALALAQYSGIVKGTIERRSVMTPYVKMRPVVGTNTIVSYGVGESTLGKVTPGEAPAPTGKHDTGKATLTVDTLILARSMVPLLEQFQTSYDARAEYGKEHGKKIGKFIDNALFTQAIKAGLLTDSAYSQGSAGKPAGWKGGSQVTLNASADSVDPAMMMKAISDLFVKMEGKDVTPREDGIILAMRAAEFYAMQDAEQIINGTYVTADGTKLDNVAIFKAYGCPVVTSNNLPNSAVSDHLLGANFNGDFTKVAALAFAPEALLGGETIPLTSATWYSEEWKHHFIDSHLSFSATPDRAEYAGVILRP